jgi:hypothetical protein
MRLRHVCGYDEDTLASSGALLLLGWTKFTLSCSPEVQFDSKLRGQKGGHRHLQGLESSVLQSDAPRPCNFMLAPQKIWLRLFPGSLVKQLPGVGLPEGTRRASAKHYRSGIFAALPPASPRQIGIL